MYSPTIKTAPIGRVLVANRGEIARRVFRTCRDRGIDTVAVFSDADRDAAFAREADRAVHLPGSAPADTYLRGDLIIAAALTSGAHAVHPGYGFLSENADFAQSVLDAGLVWLGPPPAAIAAMGSKIESKAMMADAGVPVLTRLQPDAVTEKDLPVLIKASAGGGGRGMRVVRSLADLPGEIETAAREAKSAFGDETVFCERYVETGRHIEVQIMADTHGTVWAVGERECSIQRRHQKVFEEAPAPLVERVGPGMRDRLYDAARAAAKAVVYVGAGTVEFLADHDGEFFFLEMNTRLQVEHPVTENVTGLDLVGLQLDVATGLPLSGDEPTMHGWSIEARLYAEDPAADWQPQSGTMSGFVVPGVTEQFTLTPQRGIRLDSGTETGDTIGVHYDPMLAKVIATAPSRPEACRLLAKTLQDSVIEGVITNRDLLVGVLRDPEFLSGEFDTGYFNTHDPAELTRTQRISPPLAAVVAAVADAARERATATVDADLPSGWRNVVSAPQNRTYLHDEDEIAVGYRFTRDGVVVTTPALDELRIVSVAPDRVEVEQAGLRTRYRVGRSSVRDEQRVHVQGPDGSLTLGVVPRFVDPSTLAPAGSLVAPMPGVVSRVAVSEGDTVTQGQPLLWLEAMKMEHAVLATADGVVAQLVAQGTQVEPGAVLAVVSDE